MRVLLRTLLDENVDRIVESWDARVRHTEASRGLTRAERVNRLPALLATLATGVAGSSDRASQRWLVDAHLADRLRQGFALAEMVDEFRVLLACIEETWGDRAESDRPDSQEVASLRVDLEGACSTAERLFDEDLVQYQQSEKQYLRRLQKIATESARLEPNGMLQVISEALGAETTGLYHYDRTRRELVLVASTGAESDLKDRYVTPRGAPSFASRLAESARTIYLADVGSSGLDVPEPLRKSGARSILAMPLLSRGVLFGALYAGVRDSRLFLPREVRMFESLGERFALLLEAARDHEELEASNRQLLTERELRERFVAVLAHDLLGPLAAAKMGIQLLLSHPELVSEKSSVPARILFDLDRADGMVRDMLDVHQIRVGRRLTLRIAKTDVAAIAREVADELTQQFGPRFHVASSEHEWGYWSARDLRRAIWNLASNAVKYGGSVTPVEIAIGTSGETVTISVHNEGSPIPEEDRATLFEPFARAVSEQRNAERGWGLGLTLVKGCAEAHGGTVEIASSAGAGTTFTMRMPLDARPFQPMA